MNIQQIIKDAYLGDIKAQWNLSNMYYQGDGVSKDNEKAFYWTLKAATQCHTSSQYNLGYLYWSGKGTAVDYESAFYWFSLAAEKGHAASQNYLGVMHRDGHGVDKDYEEAFIWFLMASNSSLSCCYDARKSYSGNPNALCNLGLIYAEGSRLPESKSEAAHWFNLAYIQGSKRAAKLLDEYELWDYIEKYII
jgi:TPR repeat protein